MQPHVRIYVRYFGYGEQDYMPCEICESKAVDVHHINGRCKDCNVIQNLIGLCRDCHTKSHNEQISKTDIQFIHLKFIQK